MREDCNVISVDWSILADGDYDYVAINNVPTAGVTTGAFVDFLVQQGTPLTAFHLIGFSMGVRMFGSIRIRLRLILIVIASLHLAWHF